MVGSIVNQSFMHSVRLSPSLIPSPSPSSRVQPVQSESIPLVIRNDCGNCFRSCASLLHLKNYSHITQSSSIHLHQRLKPVAALDSDVPQPSQPGKETVTLGKNGESFKQWDSWTGKFAAAANIPFLLLQMPQIVLNARNLMAGNKSALLAVSWLGILTGLLGNLSLLSYFAKKKETEAMIVQCLGVVTTYIVITQLAMAEAMPFLYFIFISVVVGTGLISNFLNYFGMLHPAIWGVWEDFIFVGGLSVLPQVMWSTFVPYVPASVFPGAIAFVTAMIAVVMARTGKLSKEGVNFMGAVPGWTATLLFMWMPVAQMWTSFLNPENIKGLSAMTMLLAMMGNGLLIPRALFVRDLMWFIGASWASFLYGWGNLICLYLFKSISQEFFLASTSGFFIWLGFTFWKDSRAHGHSSPLKSLKELVFGS